MQVSTTAQPPSVFQYLDPNRYLKDYFDYLKKRNPRFTTRALAKNLGFKSHALISFFITGKRAIKPNHLEKLLPKLKLSSAEKHYLELIVISKNAKTNLEKNFYASLLAQTVPVPAEVMLEHEVFKYIANWYHMAILEMTELADFQNDPIWIQKRLSFQVSVSEIKEAISRLITLGLLKNHSNRLTKTQQKLTTKVNGSSEAIRIHHQEILELAKDALQSQNVEERFFNSCSMTINSNQLKAVNKLILEFRNKVTQIAEKKLGDETYELSIQFFKLTKKGES